MKKENKKKINLSLTGFTLLEIIIVIIIIGILASIALPNYNRTVERSRLAEAISTLRVLRDAQLRYAAQTGDYTGTWGNLQSLDVNISSSGKFFNFGIRDADPDDGSDDTIANATRNDAAKGAGGYSLGYEIQVKESGNFTCTGTSSCPSAFLP